jgi:ABC-type lipoprotein export system ATPase subunit
MVFSIFFNSILEGKIMEKLSSSLLTEKIRRLKNEYDAVKKSAVLFDISCIGKIEIKGSDAFSFIQKLVTNDISHLSNNQGLHTLMCYPYGAVMESMILYKFSDDHYLFVINSGNIEKTFNNSIRALQGADLFVSKGEIHAIVGENAAGKSTLMNILYGSVHADSGEIVIDGKPCRIEHPADAISLGIGMVHQHFKLVPDFTVLENIILGYEKKYTDALKKIDYGKARKDIEALLRKINVELDLDKRTDSLSIGIQSKIEIVKTLFKGANIVILTNRPPCWRPMKSGTSLISSGA